MFITNGSWVSPPAQSNVFRRSGQAYSGYSSRVSVFKPTASKDVYFGSALPVLSHSKTNDTLRMLGAGILIASIGAFIHMWSAPAQRQPLSLKDHWDLADHHRDHNNLGLALEHYQQTAALLPHQDRDAMKTVLLNIADIQAQTGQSADARDTYDQARQYISPKKPVEQFPVLIKSALVEIAQGELWSSYHFLSQARQVYENHQYSHEFERPEISQGKLDMHLLMGTLHMEDSQRFYITHRDSWRQATGFALDHLNKAHDMLEIRTKWGIYDNPNVRKQLANASSLLASIYTQKIADEKKRTDSNPNQVAHYEQKQQNFIRASVDHIRAAQQSDPNWEKDAQFHQVNRSLVQTLQKNGYSREAKEIGTLFPKSAWAKSKAPLYPRQPFYPIRVFLPDHIRIAKDKRDGISDYQEPFFNKQAM